MRHLLTITINEFSRRFNEFALFLRQPRVSQNIRSFPCRSAERV